MSELPPKPTYRADADLLDKNVPDHIKRHPFFCLWKWEPNKKRDKWTKVPYNPRTGSKADSTNPSTFAPFEFTLTAYMMGVAHADGVGIGLFDGQSGTDIDHHLEGGTPDEFCAGIIEDMDAYTDISPSGDGVHIYFTAPKFAKETDARFWKTHYKKNPNNHCECYISGHTNRFFTITGNKFHDGENGDKSTQVARFLEAHMLRKRNPTPTSSTSGGPTDRSDGQLVAIAKRSKVNGGKFTRLWEGDTSGYGSPSEADQALCNFLAFYTGKDAERMDRMFRASGLYREKWEREDYRTATIEKAIEDTTDTYDPSHNAVRRARRQSGDAKVSAATIEKIDRRIIDTDIFTFDVNDLTLARGFAEVFGHIVRYVEDVGLFYVYDGKRWVQDSKASTSSARLVKLYYERVICTASSVLHDKALTAFLEAMLAYGSFTKREHLLKDARSELRSRMEDFDLNLDLLNVTNGTLDLRTLDLRPHDPADRLTKLAPVTYVPNATADEWREFLLQSLEGDADVYAYLQQQMGVTMAGDTSQEHMHLLFGPTRSGKSTCANTVKAVLGDYACGISPATITKQKRSGQNASEDLARLAGVRMGVVPEPQKGMELSAEIVKMITGNDTITARQLYQGSRDFTSCLNLWVATNHLPQIDDPTVLDSDRIVIVPFPRHLELEQRDKGLKARLLRPESKSGILNWLIEGLRSYREAPVPVPDVAEEATEEFVDQCDRVKVFVDEVLVAEEGATAPAVTLFNAYLSWAKSGNADPNKGKHEFFGDLRRLGILRDRYKNMRNVCVGYRLRE